MISTKQAPASLIGSHQQAGVFAKNYNRVPFLIEHTLHEHPLFQLPAVLEAAQRISQMPGKLYYNVGNPEIKQGWDLSGTRPFSPLEALERIESANAWMILKGVQSLPEYQEVLWSILKEIHMLSGQPLEGATSQHNMSVIITSPGRVTPYHIDADCNYLLQILGSKTAFVFDGNDPEVLTPEELERFYSGNVNAAIYRDALQERASNFYLTPGAGIHVPVTFPHWVQNGDNVSVSVSINFYFVDRTVPDIYKVNNFLRRARMRPVRPGVSPLRDRIKAGIAKTARRATGR